MGEENLKHCEKCNVNVETSADYCPLCYSELEGECNINKFKERTVNEKSGKRMAFTVKLFGFMSICVAIICTVINILADPQTRWSLIVDLSILYVWILVAHTILSKRSFFEKILFQLVMIFAILFACERISAVSPRWMLSYVCPSIAITTILTLNLFSMIGGKRYISIITCIVFYVIFFVAGSIILGINQTDCRVLYWVSIIYSIVSILGSFIFGYSSIVNEFKKKMHI